MIWEAPNGVMANSLKVLYHGNEMTNSYCIASAKATTLYGCYEVILEFGSFSHSGSYCCKVL